jgi:RNA polymerase sigma factor (TIGR02999 family)
MVYSSAVVTPSPHEITELLIQLGNGDKTALDRMMPLVYRELHKLAKQYTGQDGQGKTLQTTALVHEAYMKLAGSSANRFANREHFFAVAAKAMRQVLIDYARASRASRRGGNLATLPLDNDVPARLQPAAELIAIDDALTALSRIHPRQSEAFELRYFGGLTISELAKSLDISTDTVSRDLRLAKAWLRRELGASRNYSDAGRSA